MANEQMTMALFIGLGLGGTIKSPRSGNTRAAGERAGAGRLRLVAEDTTLYCFVNLVPARDGQGLEPEVPDDVGYLLLADFPGTDWAICEVRGNPGDHGWVPEAPVGDELALLIESGKRYPPALGLARQEVVQVFGEHLPSRDEFKNAYAVAIQAHLSRQHDAPYVMAQALRDEDGHRVKGEWYWVLQISGDRPDALWVSDDFQILSDDMNAFDFTGQQLKKLGYSG